MVWVDNTAVGRIPHSTPIAERMGRATVMEQRPTQEISCNVIIRFIGLVLLNFPAMGIRRRKACRGDSLAERLL
ncbi:hypothetical protein CLOM621_06623 [Clostridium sp. M62/1]|nr:hypothetical protein CLOM621_06623 [Clostridium sp. M62/1]